MNEQELEALNQAVYLLESPGVGVKIADMVGTPIEKIISLLPAKATDLISTAAHKSILTALKLALKTLVRQKIESGFEPAKASNWWHMAATATTGAIGGFYGINALLLELPISTTIMMRSIADVARSEGADLNDIQTQLACVQILALGGPSSNDDAAEIGYFITREAMAKAVAEAAAYILKNGIEKETAPALVRLILIVAERFSITVTQKAAAQLVPVIGAVGGALINTVFIDHYQNIARGHFTVLRLEKTHGKQLVQERYAAFKGNKK